MGISVLAEFAVAAYSPMHSFCDDRPHIIKCYTFILLHVCRVQEMHLWEH